MKEMGAGLGGLNRRVGAKAHPGSRIRSVNYFMNC